MSDLWRVTSWKRERVTGIIILYARFNSRWRAASISGAILLRIFIYKYAASLGLDLGNGIIDKSEVERVDVRISDFKEG
jgi:hypothetical protein